MARRVMRKIKDRLENKNLSSSAWRHWSDGSPFMFGSAPVDEESKGEEADGDTVLSM